MCYTYRYKGDAKVLEERYQAKVDDDFEASLYEEIHRFEQPPMPIITNVERDRIQIYTWGLIGNWIKDVDTAKKQALNCTHARIEDLAIRASYKDIYKTQKCVVLATAFIDFKHLDSKGKKKEKYELCIDDEEFAFGGLYNIWTDPISQHQFKTFTVVTTEANGIMSEINNGNRMPIMLKTTQVDLWLNATDDLVVFTEITHAQNIEAKLLDKFSQTTLF